MRVLVEEGPRYVRELIDWGVRFDRDAHGEPALGARGGAQRPPRPARGRRDRPRDRPRAVGAGVAAAVGRDHQSRARHRAGRRGRRASRGVRFFDRDGRSARGARPGRRCSPPAAPVRSSARRRIPPSRPATASRSRTTPARASPISSSCSSIRPRSIVPGAPRFLISEALRGEGARLVNARGEPFMDALSPRRRSGAARCRRAQHRARSGARRAAGVPDAGASRCRPVRARFPTIAEMCRQLGLDLATRSAFRSVRRRTT